MAKTIGNAANRPGQPGTEGVSAITQSATQWYSLHYWRAIYLVLFGMTVGAVLDYFHTDGGTIIYPDGSNHYRGIATFAVVYSGGGGGIIFTWLNRILGNKQTPVAYETSYPTVFIFCALYTFTAYCDYHTLATKLVLVAASLCMWYYQDRTMVGLMAGAVVALGGAGIEASLSHFGTMAYTSQDIIYVPIWLPAVYFASAASWGQVCRRALEVENHWSRFHCPQRRTETFSEHRDAFYYG